MILPDINKREEIGWVNEKGVRDLTY